MKQTAVEWLVDQVEDFIGLIPVDIIEQAKAMEKEQIIDAYYYDPNCDNIKDDGEEYYNETFKSE